MWINMNTIYDKMAESYLSCSLNYNEKEFSCLLSNEVEIDLRTEKYRLQEKGLAEAKEAYATTGTVGFLRNLEIQKAKVSAHRVFPELSHCYIENKTLSNGVCIQSKYHIHTSLRLIQEENQWKIKKIKIQVIREIISPFLHMKPTIGMLACR